jgi:hypothetical protein
MARGSTNMMVPLALIGVGAGLLLVLLSPKPLPTAKVPLTSAFQQEIVSVMQALGVDAGGTARGPFAAQSVARANELARRLDAAGYAEAASLIRGYAAAGNS